MLIILMVMMTKFTHAHKFPGFKMFAWQVTIELCIRQSVD
jgi:hypothetical protein